MSDPSSFFELDGDLLVPTELARSTWTGGQLHGVALASALARETEACLSRAGRSDLRPARLTVDLFRAVGMAPLEVSSVLVRQGRRLALVDAVLSQDGRAVTRASALFVLPSASAPGLVWSPDPVVDPPRVEDVPVVEGRRHPYLRSDVSGWSRRSGDHLDASRKRSWATPVPVVAGEELSGFVAAAGVADGASPVTSWGTEGIRYINADITLHLARSPIGTELGLVATDRVEQDGIAVGTATLLDRSGPLGTVVVTGLVHASAAGG